MEETSNFMTITVPGVMWDGKKHDVKVTEISWKQKKKAIRNSMKEVQRGRALQKEHDQVLMRELLVLESCIEAPFPKEVSVLDKMRSKDIERLYKAYSDLNDIEDEGDEEGELSRSGSGIESSQN